MVFENVPREKVLAVVKEKGPTIPTRIVKEVGGNTFVIGAVLSDLVNAKLIKVTQGIKMGGTPLYYADGQEPKLAEFVQYLNEKDRKVFELLQQEKVLYDDVQDPLVKVCLRNLKDFAKPIAIETKNEKDLFWRFYLVSDEEAVRIAKEFLKKRAQEQQSTPQERTDGPAAEKQRPAPTPPEKQIPVPTPSAPASPRIPAMQNVPENQNHGLEFIELKPKKPAAKKAALQEAAVQSTLPPGEPPRAAPGSFADRVFSFLAAKQIIVKEVLLVKKGEVNCVIVVPSSVGSLTEYCKAKDKKSISDGDLATAILEGQTHSLPTLFLSSGVLSKKAQQLLEQSKNVGFVQIR